MLYASANRDETVFPDADRFDVTRKNARRHLAFGAGIHMCVGMHLAILEIECLLLSMIARINGFTVGAPQVAMNNTICAYSNIPVRISQN